jgi:hypothetical protein
MSRFLDLVLLTPLMFLFIKFHGIFPNFQFQFIIHKKMLGMSSQASSYEISLLLISIRHFVGHSFQNYALFFNNIFCLIKVPNNSHFFICRLESC